MSKLKARHSGLLVPGDHIEIARPKAERPWWQSRRCPSFLRYFSAQRMRECCCDESSSSEESSSSSSNPSVICSFCVSGTAKQRYIVSLGTTILQVQCPSCPCPGCGPFCSALSGRSFEVVYTGFEYGYCAWKAYTTVEGLSILVLFAVGNGWAEVSVNSIGYSFAWAASFVVPINCSNTFTLNPTENLWTLCTTGGTCMVDDAT